MQKNNNIGNRCVIYARYSCSNQTEQSIEGQMHDCEQFAARNNLQIVNSYIDRATTATTDKRPQFLEMIADSKQCVFDVVLVWKLDRFSRNRYDSAMYKNGKHYRLSRGCFDGVCLGRFCGILLKRPLTKS